MASSFFYLPAAKPAGPRKGRVVVVGSVGLSHLLLVASSNNLFSLQGWILCLLRFLFWVGSLSSQIISVLAFVPQIIFFGGGPALIPEYFPFAE